MFSTYIFNFVLFIPLFTHQLSYSSLNSIEQNITLHVLRKMIVSQISLSQL